MKARGERVHTPDGHTGTVTTVEGGRFRVTWDPACGCGKCVPRKRGEPRLRTWHVDVEPGRLRTGNLPR